MFEPDNDSEVILARFNRLMQEILRGSINRNSFYPWEVELLLDMDQCDLRNRNRREVLRRYQRAVQRQLEQGATRPMKLSEYLAQRRRQSKSHAGA